MICFPLRASALALLIACAPASAVAQVFVGSAVPRPGSAEIGGGGFWAAGQNVSSSAATLTGNPSNGASFDLFDADPELKPAIGAVGTIGVYVTRALAIEGAVQFSRPTLDVRLTNDAEDAPDVTASTTITSFVFTGSLVYHFGRSGRTTPFIAGGAGHIRDVHTGNEVVDTGVEYHGKAGVKSWFGRRRNVAFRAEAGISVRDGGFSFDEDRRIVPAVAASLLYLF